MDNMHGDSISSFTCEIIAYANRIWNVDFYLLLVLCTAVALYVSTGTRFDLLCNIVLLAHLNHSVLALCICLMIQYLTELFIFLVLVLVAYLVFASRNPDQSSYSWQGPGQPYLIPCRTTHRRFFPAKHSFSYSYLMVGVPVDFKGSANGMIEVDDESNSPFGLVSSFTKTLSQSWYRIESSGYLDRGYEKLGLRGKLDRYLQTEGVNPIDFPYAYLVTAAKFGGYQFNPVSFWYLYSFDKTLSAIVLEVNNTFYERRPYLLVRDFTARSGDILPIGRLHVKGFRVKDFHVSPFSSRKGYYSVKASDPLGVGMSGFRGIDVTITLNSSKGHPKLVARLFSEGQAVNPMSLGLTSKLMFLTTWFWVGFATMPRITKEAILLLYRHKLHMWNTPVPLIKTLGRPPNSVEKIIESCFREYLKFLVQQSRKPLLLKYHTSGLLSSTEMTCISSRCQDLQNSGMLELRILTPAFYRRFIQYGNSLNAMIAELEENKTIWVNKPELLADLFMTTNIAPLSVGFMDFVFGSVVKHMRQRPPKPHAFSHLVDLPHTPTFEDQVEDVHWPSGMDAYIISHKDGMTRWKYQWAIIRQLIADRYFLGHVNFFNYMANIIRIGIISVYAYSLLRVMRRFT